MAIPIEIWQYHIVTQAEFSVLAALRRVNKQFKAIVPWSQWVPHKELVHYERKMKKLGWALDIYGLYDVGLMFRETLPNYIQALDLCSMSYDINHTNEYDQLREIILSSTRYYSATEIIDIIKRKPISVKFKKYYSDCKTSYYFDMLYYLALRVQCNGILNLYYQLRPDEFHQSLNSRFGPNGLTPLAAACYNGNRAVVTYLITKGADIRKTTYDGRTPLELVRETGRTDIVDLLLAHIGS